MKTKIKTIKITGNGTSLWCEPEKSKKSFNINYMLLNNFCGGDAPYELQLFGPKTEWFHYTDKQINKEVNEKLMPLVQACYPDYRITEIGWSEQGMQPKNGWSFDIVVHKDDMKKLYASAE